MPNWKKVIVSGSDAALNSLNVTAQFTASGLNYPNADGVSNQVLKTNGAGNLFFDNVITTTISIKNVSGGTITKGTPCYITGSGTSGNVAGVWPADASNPLRMPAGVIAGEDLIAGAEGVGLLNGFINGVDTSAFNSGDSVYVAAGGGYTNTRPTGSTIFVQKLGNVEKVDALNGSGVIHGPGYYNDLPNVQSGYTWVGNSNGVATAIATSSIQNVVSSSFASTASLSRTTQNVAIPLSSGYFGYLEASGTSYRLQHSNSGTHIIMNATNTTSFGQVCSFNNGVGISPGGNSTSQALGVGVGIYPSAIIATFASGSTIALRISGSGMIGTGSFAYSGSITTNNIIATQNVTASRVYISSSNGTTNGSTLTVYGSGSSQPVFTVQGSQGELFSVTDSLSGSLYSVNDISGLPILEVFSDSTVLLGNYQDPMLITTTKLVTTASGAFTLYALPTASYDTAFFEYSIRSGSNARAGSIMAIQSGTSVNFTETTTTDFGSTSGFGFTVQVSGANMLLTGSATTSGWTIKTIVRSI